MAIVVEEYTNQWKVWFDELSAWLKLQLRNEEDSHQEVAVVSIEHVGSTSVPGLAAKPIIDIDIVVTSSQLHDVLHVLESKGHVNRGDLGIADRYAIKLLEAPHCTNTYVVLQDSIALRNHIAVREILTTNEELCRRYAACKRVLVRETEDMGRYCEGKSDLLREILTAHGSLTSAEIQSIYDSNTK